MPFGNLWMHHCTWPGPVFCWPFSNIFYLSIHTHKRSLVKMITKDTMDDSTRAIAMEEVSLLVPSHHLMNGISRSYSASEGCSYSIYKISHIMTVVHFLIMQDNRRIEWDFTIWSIHRENFNHSRLPLIFCIHTHDVVD